MNFVWVRGRERGSQVPRSLKMTVAWKARRREENTRIIGMRLLNVELGLEVVANATQMELNGKLFNLLTRKCTVRSGLLVDCWEVVRRF